MASHAKLAIEGGAPAVSGPLPPMYPGGMRIGHDEEEAVLAVLRTRRLFRYYGPQPGPSRVADFERAFAERIGAAHAVAVTSGTAALICGLAALGVGPGDEVIVPAYTWIATASAAVALGAVPIMAEVDESLTLDLRDVAQKISPYTRAIIPVHMRGAPCKIDALIDLARQHRLGVLEDTAQAAGASYRGRPLGTWGDIGAFSLQFNKIITSGEGGVAVTSDPELHKRIVMYHDVVGGLRNNIPADEILPGVNFRMTELQAAIAHVQLGRLDSILGITRRRKAQIKQALDEAVEQAGVQFRTLHDAAGEAAIALVMFMPDATRATWATAALRAEGISAGRLYQPDRVDYHVYRHWAPIMQQRAWSERGGPWRNHPRPVQYTDDMCPRTLDLLERAVHIDINPELTDEQAEEVTEGIYKVLRALSATPSRGEQQ